MDKNTPNFILLEDDKEIYNDRPEERLYADTDSISPKKPRKKNRFKKLITVILIVVISAAGGFGGGIAAMYYASDEAILPHTINDITIQTNSDINTAEAVAAKVIPSVVGISTTAEVVRQNIFGMPSGQLVEGVGTGFIVDEDGYIVTNSHVVNDGSAKTITVQLTDGREMEGTVLWNDSTLDLAMVKVNTTNLIPVEFGDSDKVNIGAYAVAIGNPFGLAFDRSVTQGVISGLNRTITVGGNNMQSSTMEGLIQTDASINSGNSGGPLLNAKGQVIGINTAKASSGEGLGFAIPINTVKPIIEEIMETGTFKKAYIGIGGSDVELFKQYYPQVDLGTNKGVYVRQIYTGSPAAEAGLKEGDVIVALDDKEIESMIQLTKELFHYKPGDTVNITLYRDRQKIKLDLTLSTAE